MLLTKPLVATILVGVGLAHTTDVSTTVSLSICFQHAIANAIQQVEIEPDSAPQTTYAEELTTVSTLLPLPTVVIEPTKVNDTAPIFNGTYHALGVDAAPQATQTFVPLIWEQVVTSDPFAGPPPLPDGTNGVVANVTFTNSTAAPGLSLNFTQEAEVVKKRFWSLTKRALPTVVDWRSKWGINWLASIQVCPSLSSVSQSHNPRHPSNNHSGPGALRFLLGLFRYRSPRDYGPHPTRRVVQAL